MTDKSHLREAHSLRISPLTTPYPWWKSNIPFYSPHCTLLPAFLIILLRLFTCLYTRHINNWHVASHTITYYFYYEVSSRAFSLISSLGTYDNIYIIYNYWDWNLGYYTSRCWANVRKLNYQTKIKKTLYIMLGQTIEHQLRVITIIKILKIVWGDFLSSLSSIFDTKLKNFNPFGGKICFRWKTLSFIWNVDISCDFLLRYWLPS